MHPGRKRKKTSFFRTVWRVIKMITPMCRTVMYIQIAIIAFEIVYLMHVEIGLKRYLDQRPAYVRPNICTRWGKMEKPAVKVDFKKQGSKSKNMAFISKFFHMLGFVNNMEDWDVLWSDKYPYDIPPEAEHCLQKTLNIKATPLLGHQKVNHLPASGLFAYKDRFVKAAWKYAPETFFLPKEKDELLERLQLQLDNGEERTWIQKDAFGGGKRIKQIKETVISLPSTIQHYITNPFLIGRRKFSLGVYVLWTAFDPFRTYVVDTEMSIMFCPKDYNPKNFTDRETFIADGIEYIKGDTYDQIPVLKRLVELEYSGVQALRAYFESVGWEPSTVFEQINDVIAYVSSRLQSKTGGFDDDITYLRNAFFEIMRLDFLVDDNLKVHVFEANPEPKIPASDMKNRRTREATLNLLFNSFRLTGLEHFSHVKYKRPEYVFRRSDVLIASEMCYLSTCNKTNTNCTICPQYLSEDHENILLTTLAEHINRGPLKRAFPRPVKAKKNKSISKAYQDTDKLLAAWFQQKCKQDDYWCS